MLMVAERSGDSRARDRRARHARAHVLMYAPALSSGPAGANLGTPRGSARSIDRSTRRRARARA
eukprot:COSAG02_NODE_49087_length_316_cov_0.682609_1_plen_63_part_10